MELTSVMLIRGLVGLVAGALAIIWPGLTIAFLIALFGAYAFIDGITNLVLGLRHGDRYERRWAPILEGIVGIAAGVVAFLWPGITALALLVVIAAWAIVTGVFEIVAAIRLRGVVQRDWLLALSGILSVILGILLFAFPAMGAVGIAWALGFYALLSGAMIVVLAIRLRTRPAFA